jgi:hypothetical protein
VNQLVCCVRSGRPYMPRTRDVCTVSTYTWRYIASIYYRRIFYLRVDSILVYYALKYSYNIRLGVSSFYRVCHFKDSRRSIFIYLICPNNIKLNDVLVMGIKRDPLCKVKDINDRIVKIYFSGKYLIQNLIYRVSRKSLWSFMRLYFLNHYRD